MADTGDYEDAPAERVQFVCPTCRGEGEVAMPLTPAVPGMLAGYERVRPCREHRPGGRRGRIGLGSGPGARIRPWERVAVPGVDDWGPRGG